MPFITYPQPNGQVAVIIPADPNLSIEEIAAKDVPVGLPYKIVDSLEIDNDYFNAYDFHPEDGVIENITRAQDIQKNNWRKLRSELLTTLDIHFNIALEKQDTRAQKTIASQKQALRDVTKADLPSDSIANIKAIVPDILTQTYIYPVNA
jgi:hypothetical protein